MRVFKVFLIIIAAVVVSGIVIVSTSVIQGKVETNQTQEALDPFYTPPNPLVGNPGEIIRTEPIANYPITGATATASSTSRRIPLGICAQVAAWSSFRLRLRLANARLSPTPTAHERARRCLCTFAQRADASESAVHSDAYGFRLRLRGH